MDEMALYRHHRYFGLVWALWILSWLQFVRCDIMCNNGPGNPIAVCFGETAYCCGEHLHLCCAHEVWDFWWFWVMALIVIGAILSCLCFFRYNRTLFQRNPRGGGSDCIVLATRSFPNNRQDLRRPPLSSSVLTNNRRNQATRSISLPPYFPLSNENTEDNDDVILTTQHSIPYIEPPPPYTIVLSRPQPSPEILLPPVH